MSKDPYVYPNSSVLKNKLNIRDPNELEQVELIIVSTQSIKPIPQGDFGYDHLKAIHHHLFHHLYDWAGQERTVSISKGNSLFALPQRITACINISFNELKNENLLKNLSPDIFIKKAAHYFNEINAIHPFREGNGRILRIFFNQLALGAGYNLNWEKADRQQFINASIQGFHHSNHAMEEVFKRLTEPNKSLHKNSLVQKNAHINWQSDKYKKDWVMLHTLNNKNVQWLVKFYELARAKKNEKEIASVNQSITNKIQDIVSDKVTFDLIKQVAPALSETMQQIFKLLNRDKGIDRN